jgi:hypothetical protein
MLGGLLKIIFGGLMLWGAVTWLGAGFAALGVAILATLLAGTGLDAANRHAMELQRLRERLTTLEENLNRSHERASDAIDRMSEQNHRLSERLERLEPIQFEDDY